MKKILITLFILTFLCQILYSQNSNEYLIKSVFLEDLSSEDISLGNYNRGDFLLTLFDIHNDYEFRNQIINRTNDPIREYDDLGYVHERYDQYYKGIKIEHSDIRTQYLNDLLVSVTGEYIDVQDIDISILLSEKTAVEKAIKYIGASQYMWEDEKENNWLKEFFNDPTASFYPNAEIVICLNSFDLEDTLFHVAYKIDIYAKEPGSRNYIYVDAISGDIIDVDPIIRNIYGTADTRFSSTRSISTQLYNGTYRLRGYDNNLNIETYNMQKSGTILDAIDFTDNDNYWSAAEFDNANKDDAGLDAHWGAMMAWDYFKNIHERNSYDNNGSVIKNYVNANLRKWDPNLFPNSNNAFWEPTFSVMIYGYGSADCDPFTSLDVVAHEIGHGICQYSANLVYRKEFGAINESLSDIWAACIQNYAAPEKQIWLLMDELCFVINPNMCNMSNPTLYGQPDTYKDPIYWMDVDNCTPDQNQNDLCWVHTNSGVMNHWFYILSVGKSGTNGIGNSYNVEGIGINKAEKIVYRAETKYMTRRTDFSKARKHTIKAAKDLYGKDSYEVQMVTNAWYAVGVGDPFTCKTKTICDKTYGNGTHKIEGCRIEICNTFIQNGSTVKVNATDWVKICTGFVANAGSYVFIGIDGPSASPAPPQPYSYIFTPNYEFPIEDPNLQSLATNNTDIKYSIPNFTLYPNPNPGVFQLETNFPLSDIAHLKVANTLGISVYETKNIATNTIQLQDAASGMFFVVVILKDGTVLTQKMMVQR